VALQATTDLGGPESDVEVLSFGGHRSSR
jgi:hypothetical protein